MSPFLYITLKVGGGKRDRTADPLLAGQVLYQLSYAPTYSFIAKAVNCFVAVYLYKTNAPKL